MTEEIRKRIIDTLIQHEDVKFWMCYNPNIEDKDTLFVSYTEAGDYNTPKGMREISTIHGLICDEEVKVHEMYISDGDGEAVQQDYEGCETPCYNQNEDERNRERAAKVYIKIPRDIISMMLD